LGRACNAYGGDGYKILVGKPEGKKPTWRQRHRWEGNTKIYLEQTGFKGVD
jgi:hypothetical protein